MSAAPQPRPATLHARARARFITGFELDVDFSAAPGITIVFGGSGSGKSTLLQCLAGLLVPDEGRIDLAGRTLCDCARAINVPVPQRRIGYLFQDLALFPHLTAAQNVGFGLAHLPRAERERRVSTILESFHIGHRAGSKPADLSGGERQRVALARALVTDPDLLLLDEPLSALDAATQSRIFDDLRAWNAARQVPILYVTHSLREAFALGERVLVLERGRIIADGPPPQVLAAPRHETLAQLAGFENLFDAEVTALHELEGTMTCRLAATDAQLEVPLARMEPGARCRVAIRAGDILLARSRPEGLSARNVLRGRVTAVDQLASTVVARIAAGPAFEVHITPAARQALGVTPGAELWLVIKTFSCHVVAPINVS